MTQPTLYILMRTDMTSLNPGKAMAQAAHAANAFHAAATDGEYPLAGFDDWLGLQYAQPYNFGTTIVLAVTTERELREVIDGASEDGFEAGIIVDPSYPVRDGKVTHLLPVATCGYAFTQCRKTHPISTLAGLNLHK